jgi:hypothetical protein
MLKIHTYDQLAHWVVVVAHSGGVGNVVTQTTVEDRCEMDKASQCPSPFLIVPVYLRKGKNI